jgi:hypothetical protein
MQISHSQMLLNEKVTIAFNLSCKMLSKHDGSFFCLVALEFFKKYFSAKRKKG